MNRVIVSGMGVLSAAGWNLSEFWNTLFHCRITYGPIANFVSDVNYRIKIGSKIYDSHWKQSVPDEILEHYGHAAAYAAFTAQQAAEDSGITFNQIDPARIAVVMGTTMGEIEVEEQITENLYEKNLSCSKKECLKYDPFHIVRAVAQVTGSRGYAYLIPAACAAGNYAVSVAKQLIDWNYADVVIAGGVDVFSRVAFSGFQRLLSLSPDLCRPFDKKRSGLVIGEGCGILILEKEGIRAKQKSYGCVMGTGLASTAYHMTAPHPEAQGELLAMQKALEDGGVDPEAVDCISAHGTGTKANDRAEALAIRTVFSDVKRIPVSAIKSVLGHSMGAAGALELIASFLMLQRHIILPTANFKEKDEECDLDCVPNIPRPAKLQRILSNAFAFGGQTSSVLIGE